MSCSQAWWRVQGFEGTERKNRISISVVLNKDSNLYNCESALAQKSYKTDQCDTASIVDWLHACNHSDQFADENTATYSRGWDIHQSCSGWSLHSTHVLIELIGVHEFEHV